MMRLFTKEGFGASRGALRLCLDTDPLTGFSRKTHKYYLACRLVRKKRKYKSQHEIFKNTSFILKEKLNRSKSVEERGEAHVGVGAQDAIHRAGVAVLRGNSLNCHVSVDARDTVVGTSVSSSPEATLNARPGVGTHLTIEGASVAVLAREELHALPVDRSRNTVLGRESGGERGGDGGDRSAAVQVNSSDELGTGHVVGPAKVRRVVVSDGHDAHRIAPDLRELAAGRHERPAGPVEGHGDVSVLRDVPKVERASRGEVVLLAY